MKIRRSLVALCYLAWTSALATESASASPLPLDRPLYMAVFGDSVTRGTMADAQMGAPNARFYADMLRGKAVVGFQMSVNALFGKPNPTEGDIASIERNFSHMSRLPLSAFVGDREYSLPKHIEQATSYRPRVYNGAILAAGFHTADIALTRFERHQRSGFGHAEPDLIVVNFNGIDFINNVSIETFTKDVSHFLTRIKKLAPHALVFITEFANPIPTLTAPDRQAAPRTILTPNGLTCHTLYRQLQFAAKTGISSTSTPEEIALATERLTAMRDIVAAAIDRTNRESPSGEIVLIKGMSDDEGADASSHLAADCIHPDVSGQKIIGDQLWKAVSDYFY